MIEAQARGFDNCLMRDMLGNVAELGTANVFMAKDGVVYTPVAERHLPQRHHAPACDRAAARAPASTVVEKTLTYADFQGADEIFSTGNFSKVSPVTRIDERALQPGAFYRKARELYWDYAHSRLALGRAVQSAKAIAPARESAPASSSA